MALGTLAALEDLTGVFTSVADFGEAQLAQRFNEALDIHNEIVDENVRDFAMTTAEPQLPYGIADTVDMMEIDELGSADAVKAYGAGNMGFPLRMYVVGRQWTRLYLQRHTVADLAIQADAYAAADLRNMHRAFKRALFTPTNSTYIDVNDTGLTLSLKALLNADGSGVPIGPNGETFTGASHTHYLATASFVLANLQSLMGTVTEHGVNGSVRIYINRAQETAVRGLASSSFAPYTDVRVVQPSTTTYAQGVDLDNFDPNNRALGIFEGAEVWVKPWVPAGYMIAFDTGVGDGDKPLGIRTRTGALTGLGSFAMLADQEEFPLRAQQFGREFGVSVWQRHKAAVLYIGGGSYVTPTIT